MQKRKDNSVSGEINDRLEPNPKSFQDFGVLYL